MKKFTRLLLSAMLIVQIGHAQVNSQKIDSLNRVLLESKNPEVQYKVLFDGLFVEYVDKDNEVALDYVSRANQIAISNGDSLNIVRSGRGKGYVLGKLGRNEESIHVFLSVLKIAQRNKFLDLEKFLLNNIALAYTYQANYDKALEFHFKSLSIREASGVKSEISVTKNNIGLVYYRLKDFEKALNFYQESLDIKIEISDSYDIERSYINIGLCYLQLKKYNKVPEYIKAAFDSCDPNCKDAILMEGHAALGLAYKDMGKINDSFLEFKRTLEIAQRVKDIQFESESYYNFGLIELLRNNPQEAIINLKISEELLKKTTNREELLRVYKTLSDIFTKQDDLKNAVFYQAKHINLKDSVYSEELIKNLSRVESAYLERENIKTIQEKNENIQLQNELISRQRLQYFFIVLVAILIIGLAMVLLWANRRQHIHNAALSEAKRVIEEQNKQLTVTNEELDNRVQEKTQDLFDTNETLIQVNDELDNFVYRTSHDLRGPLVTLKGVCNVAMLDVKDDLAQDYLKRLDITAAKLNAILTRLLVVNQVNHVEIEASKINLEFVLDQTITSQKEKGVPSRLNFEYQIDPKVNLISDIRLVKIVLENLIDNSVKFYNTSERITPFVKIAITKGNSGNIKIYVEDNGIGISTVDKDQIFHLFVRASERSETGGIGLYLTKLAAQRLGGGIKLLETSDKGSKFLVLLPEDINPILAKRKALEEQRLIEKERRKRESGEKGSLPYDEEDFI